MDYALRLDIGAVIRRLGFLLETFEVDAPREIERLREQLTATYAILDPLLPEEGRFLALWRLRLNVDPEEIARRAAIGPRRRSAGELPWSERKRRAAPGQLASG